MTAIIQEPYRCLVTTNPVGTDTEMLGRPCQCQVCRAVREIELWQDRYESLLRDARASERNFDEFMRRAGWDT